MVSAATSMGQKEICARLLDILRFSFLFEESRGINKRNLTHALVTALSEARGAEIRV